jgi:uncharacterized membrane protein
LTQDCDPERPLFSGNPARERFVRLTLPFVLCACYLGVIATLLTPGQFSLLAGLIIAYIVPPAGKETVIPLGIVLGLPWWLMAVTIALFDVFGAIFMVWNFPLACRIPVLGPWLERTMVRSRAYLDENPWFERFSYLALSFFVLIPFESSGGVSGAVIGRLIGMRSTAILICVSLGAFAGCFAIALGAGYVMALFGGNVFLGLQVLAVMLIACAGAAGVACLVRKRRRSRMK